MKIAKIFLLFNTLKHLKPSQAFYFVLNRGVGFRCVSEANIPEGFSCDFKITCPNYKKTYSESSSSFTFLNESRSISIENVDWCPQGTKRLWRYNLHYFDFLSQSDVCESTKKILINSWIEKNTQGSQPAWEPYTASLRIVNWVKYFSGNQVSSAWNNSLFVQARWLRKNLELHILANHYFENLKALVFAASYFNAIEGPLSKEASEWLKYSLRSLLKQLDEQFLDDGGHYERTPSYHILLLYDCMELLSLLKGAGPSINKNVFSDLEALASKLQQTIQAGMHLACRIARPDGLPPLFRDSAFDSCPPLDMLIQFAGELDVGISGERVNIGTFEFKSFGVFGYKSATDWLAINASPVGPSYQPGHTHCDMLSFELVHSGFPVVVDSGVFEYEPGRNRKYFRSTEAHNTVAVEGEEQSEIWGEFRVGRRASVSFNLMRSDFSDHQVLQFCGSVASFRSPKSGIHNRQLNLCVSEGKIKYVEIEDCIEHPQRSEAIATLASKSMINLHPGIVAAKKDDSNWVLTRAGKIFAYLIFDENVEVFLGEGMYSPEFGVLNKTIKFTCIFNRTLKYRFEFVSE